MTVYVVTIKDDFEFSEIVGVYTTKALAEIARTERAEKEGEDSPFTINIESVDIISTLWR
jgi:hypothetical protein